MKKSLLLILTVLTLASCMDNADDISFQTLEGKWVNQINNENEYLEVVYVFQSDGTFENFFIRTESHEGFGPGILASYRGNYAITDGKLVFSNRKYFYAEDYENPSFEQESLVEQTNFPIATQRADLSFEANKSVMVLVYECNDMITDFALTMCLEPRPISYNRVME
jgi:hypothetical protein